MSFVRHTMHAVATTLIQHQKSIQYGSIDSVRVPFVEEAVKEFQHIAKEEREVYTNALQHHQQQSKQQSQTIPNNKPHKTYALVSLLLTIKGDHTRSGLLNVNKKRDIGRALSRISTDVRVEGCLVGSEVLWAPNLSLLSTSVNDGRFEGQNVNNGYGWLLSEQDVGEAFPDLAPLS